MKKIFLFSGCVMLALLAFFLLNRIFLQTQVPSQEAETNTVPEEQQIVGGDTDEHGCIGSAGYSWCEPKQKCLRAWEEACTPSEMSSDALETIKTRIKKALVEKHGQNAEKLTVSVSKTDGTYAQGGASQEGMGGGMWFAAKVNEEWKLVWDGNGIIECNSVTNYPNFPTTMIPECFDTSTQEMVKR